MPNTTLATTGKWGIGLSSIISLALSLFNAWHGGTGPTPGPFVRLPDRITASAGTMFVVKAESNCKSVTWTASDGLKFVDQPLLNPSANAQIGIATVPGQYRIMAYAALNDVPIKSNECIVTITGAQPPPGPQPEPNPQPQPLALDRPLGVLIFDDATKRTQTTADVIGNMTFWASVEAAGHQRKFCDVTDPHAARFSREIGIAGGPTILVTTIPDGTPVNNPSEYRLPESVDGVCNLINKYTTRRVSVPRSETTSPPQAMADPQRRKVVVTVYVQDGCAPCAKCKRDVSSSKVFEIEGAKVDVDFEFRFTKEAPAWANDLPRPCLHWKSASGRERYTVGWRDFRTWYDIWQRADESNKVASL